MQNLILTSSNTEIFYDMIVGKNIYGIILFLAIGAFLIINRYLEFSKIKKLNKPLIELWDKENKEYEYVENSVGNKYIGIGLIIIIFILLIVNRNNTDQYQPIYIIIISLIISEYINAIITKNYYRAEKSFIYHGHVVQFKNILGSTQVNKKTYKISIKGQEKTLEIPQQLYLVIYKHKNDKK